MADKYTWLLWVGLAGLAWGTYVPLIAYGGSELVGKPGSLGPRVMAVLCVGMAYFVIGVLFPLYLFLSGRVEWPTATATVAPSGGLKTIKLDTLAINSTAKLDLKDNKLIVAGGNVAAVTSLIASGRNGGNWTGSGHTKIGVMAPQANGSALWVLDTTGDGVFRSSDFQFSYGIATDHPAVDPRRHRRHVRLFRRRAVRQEPPPAPRHRPPDRHVRLPGADRLQLPGYRP